MRHRCPTARSRAYFSTSAQCAICELLYLRSCAVRGRSRAFALRIVRPLTAHAMTLMTYPHSPLCTITHYRYSDRLYSHSITTTTSPHTRIAHTHPTFPFPHVSTIGVVHCLRNWYWHCLSLLFARTSCTRCRINASNTKLILESHGRICAR